MMYNEVKEGVHKMGLKEQREIKGFSQKQLSEAAGISVRYLQNYEQGVRDINGAKLKTLIRLAIELNCEVSDIVTDPELIELLKIKGAN